MRVLLTGAAGLIGRASARLLSEGGHEVLATDLRPPRAAGAPPATATASGAVRWERLDVRHGEKVLATLAEHRPDAVVHLAARHFIPWCERFPAATLQTNVVGTQNVIEGALRAGVPRLLFASSAAVYAPSAAPLREDSPLGPDDVYGASKAAGEQLVALACARGLDGAVLRLFNTIGPGDPNPHLIPRLVGELRRPGGRVRLGNLGSVRDYVFVEDVARAVLAALRASPPGLATVNVAAGAGRSVGEVLAVVEALLGRELEVVSSAALRRSVDRPVLVADVERARALLGWEPRVPFAEGLARTLRASGVLPADGDRRALVGLAA
jgi:UDP-glucose 4-epimerase